MADKKQASILIVDDESEIRDILLNILSRKYAFVKTAEDGVMALEMLEERSYDLLLVDLNMPKMMGHELVKKIRSQGDQRTALIILTGHGSFKDAHDLLKGAGISDFLNKPVDRAELLFSIERALREQRLTRQLEEQVAERTAELHVSRTVLVQTEKMASLGRLVAGVAHEVNTPIGTALLSISHLEEREHAFSNALNSGGITKNELGVLLETIRETVYDSKAALGEANHRVLGFKQLAVDQATESRRKFSLHKIIESVISSFQLHTMAGFNTSVNCPADILLDSFPGPLGQVLTSLVENSLLHGFEGRQSGSIKIDVAEDGTFVVIRYHDNGIGMEKTIVEKVFDPFFTTKVNQGGNGIGMSVSFNLVTELLGGMIQCDSTLGEGTTFTIRVPLEAASKEGKDE